MNNELYLVSMDVQGFLPGAELMVFPAETEDGGYNLSHTRERFDFAHLEDYFYFAFNEQGGLDPVDLDVLEQEYLELEKHQLSVTECDPDTMIYSPEREYYQYKVLKEFYAVDQYAIDVSPLFALNTLGENGYEYLLSYTDLWEIFFEGDWSVLQYDIIPLLKPNMCNKVDDDEPANWGGIQVTTLWEFQTETYNDYFNGPENEYYMEYKGVLSPDKIEKAVFEKEDYDDRSQ